MLDLRQVGCRQSQFEVVHFHVVGTGTAEITEGKYLGTLVHNGTGDYTITLSRPGDAARRLAVLGWSPVTAGLVARHVVTAGTVQLVWTTAAGGVATDCEFDLLVGVYFRPEQN